jgi:L-lactate permease
MSSYKNLVSRQDESQRTGAATSGSIGPDNPVCKHILADGVRGGRFARHSRRILVGLGYEPMMAALVCLVANTGPGSFGSLAIPLDTLALITQLDWIKLSQMTGRLIAPLSFVMAFATVDAMSGLRGIKGSLTAILIAGITFGAVQFRISGIHPIIGLSARLATRS